MFNKPKIKNSYSEKSKRKAFLNKSLYFLVFFVLIILVSFLVSIVEKIQGTSRVINYVGIVRGGTQRLVKLEISGEENIAMQKDLGLILYSLIFGSERLDIVKVKDDNFEQKLAEMLVNWGELSYEIDTTRKYGYESSNIIYVSEEYFRLSDEASDSVERYVVKLEKKLLIVEILLLSYIVVFVIYLIYKTTKSMRLISKNKEISKKAYTDMHTGLANKSKCNEILSNSSMLDRPTCFIMFDLNYLKRVNDTLGHIAGDTLIYNFAQILSKTIGKNGFVGRFGGDEFIAIIKDVSLLDIGLILDELATEVSKYNMNGEDTIPISYSCGYAFSDDYKECSLQTLLDKADHNMYINKHSFKNSAENASNNYYLDK